LTYYGVKNKKLKSSNLNKLKLKENIERKMKKKNSFDHSPTKIKQNKNFILFIFSLLLSSFFFLNQMTSFISYFFFIFESNSLIKITNNPYMSKIIKTKFFFLFFDGGEK
jgi:hypothetical protein